MSRAEPFTDEKLPLWTRKMLTERDGTFGAVGHFYAKVRDWDAGAVQAYQEGYGTLTVDGNGIDSVGLYSFQLLGAAPAPQQFGISFGDTVSDGVPAAGAGNLEAPGAVDIYTFDALAGQGAIFDWLSGSNVLIGWQLQAPS